MDINKQFPFSEDKKRIAAVAVRAYRQTLNEALIRDERDGNYDASDAVLEHMVAAAIWQSECDATQRTSLVRSFDNMRRMAV